MKSPRDGGKGLTCRETPLYGASRTTIGRRVSLARLALDIQKVVARLTTTTATEPIDRKKLEWVAEPVKWPEQRARFQKVMDEAFGAEPAPSPAWSRMRSSSGTTSGPNGSQ